MVANTDSTEMRAIKSLMWACEKINVALMPKPETPEAKARRYAVNDIADALEDIAPAYGSERAMQAAEKLVSDVLAADMGVPAGERSHGVKQAEAKAQ